MSFMAKVKSFFGVQDMTQGKPMTGLVRFSVPLLILADILILSVMWYVTVVVLKIRPTPQSFHTFLPLRVVPVFFALVAFRSYSTVWGRAMLSNYIRLILGVALGVLCSVVIIVLLGYNEGRTLAFPAIHFGLPCCC